MNIYLIRHGRQNSGLCNVDVELSLIGRRQAELLGERLISYNIDVLYSSDLLRAVETAEIINEKLLVKHKIDKNLREIDFGKWEGMTDEYIGENFREFKKERDSLMSDIPFPDGECGQDVFDRAVKVIKEIVDSGLKNVAVVTHGGLIRSLVAGLLTMEQSKKLLLGLTLENTGITHLYYDDIKKRFYLERFNDFSHIENEKELLRKNWNR